MGSDLSSRRTHCSVQNIFHPPGPVVSTSIHEMKWLGSRQAYMEGEFPESFDLKQLFLSFFVVLAAFTIIHHAFRVCIACCRNGRPCGCCPRGEESEEV